MWQRLTRILSREGAAPRVSDFFFKAVVQLVLIFGTEIWVVAPRMGRVLGEFQDKLSLQFIGRIPQRRTDVKWEYNSLVAAIEEVVF